ncbi:MAG: type III-B CRISPR-associated protein Cas10/Cmr2 [Flammeovirgaceae bacterium]
MSYLFHLAIGPVQSFIKQSRKTRDLFAGSRLLSNLAGYAYDHVLPQLLEQGENRDFYIFPHYNNAHKPNVLLAEVDLSPTMSIQEFGMKVSADLVSHLEKLVEETFDAYKLELTSTGKRQILDTFKIYWSACQQTGNYRKDFLQVIQIMQGAKATRSMKSLPNDAFPILPSNMLEQGRKCTLTGDYVAKYYRLTDNEKTPPKGVDLYDFLQQGKLQIIVPEGADAATREAKKVIFPRHKEHSEIKVRHIMQGEGLSAISMFKRLYKMEGDNFPSVTQVALMDIEYYFKKQSPEEVLAYCEFLNQCNIEGEVDYQLFHEESHTKKKFAECKRFNKAKDFKVKDFYAAFSNLNTLLRKHQLYKLKYYATLLFDADKMGEMLSGNCWMKPDVAEEKANQALLEFQKKLSERLGEFAREAKAFIDKSEKGYGRTVYAGGDDFLGFLNLSTLWEAVRQLRTLFDKYVAEPMFDYCRDSGIAKPTLQPMSFSAGIAIAHYKTPLGVVLDAARAAEKVAKKDGGRNAFAISVLKRSGEQLLSYWKWQYTDCEPTLNWFEKLTTMILDGTLPTRAIPKYHASINSLIDLDGDIHTDQQQADLMEFLENEFIRIMGKGQKQEVKQKLKELSQDIFKAYQKGNQMTDDPCTEDKQKQYMAFQNLLNALHSCDFIARHCNHFPTSKTPTA